MRRKCDGKWNEEHEHGGKGRVQIFLLILGLIRDIHVHLDDLLAPASTMRVQGIA